MHAMTAPLSGGFARFFRAVLLIASLGGASAAAQAADKLYIFTEHYPPYNASINGEGYAHSEDDITGICTDMVKAMLARVDYDYVIKMRAWSYIFERVQDRANHGLYCTARTPEREELFHWVGPLAPIKWTLFAAPDSDLTLSSLEQAKDLRIAGYKGDVMSEYLVDQGYNVVMSLSGDMNPQRLVLGQADLWVTDGLVGPLVAKKDHGIEGLKPLLVFRETPMYLALSKKTAPAVVADLQRALDEARSAGELDAIVARYD